MNFLYLVKTSPKREYCLSKALKFAKKDINIDGVAFSRRNYLDIFQLNSTKVFNHIYDFTKFCQGESKNAFDKQFIDNELLRFELELNLPINQILYSDRTLINYSERNRRKILFLLINFALKVCEENAYDAIIGELSSASDMIFYYLSKKYKYKYIFFWHGRVDNTIEFTDVTGNRFGLANYYEEFKNKGIDDKTQEILNDYLEKFMINFTPDYMKYTDQTKVKVLFRKVFNEAKAKRLAKYVKSYKVDTIYSADMSPAIKGKIENRVRKFKLPFKLKTMKKYYKEPDLSCKYYLLPLHYQPEASTMTYAQYYLNQLAFIENISKSIPGGTYLYVKEHPAMFLDREKSFYKELAKLPNVNIVHPRYKMNTLIQNALGVITLTNTTGYEAIILDKPVFVFGNVFYQEYDYIFKNKNFEEFRKNTLIALKEWELNKEARKKNKECFIASSLKSLREGNFNTHISDPTVLCEQNLDVLAKNILEYYNSTV